MKKTLALLLICAASSVAHAAPVAGVFPVKGVFYNQKDLDAFSDEVRQVMQEPAFLGWAAEQAKVSLDSVFEGRVGVLNARNASKVFAVSVQLTRGTLYKAPKADGNIEIRVPLTGSVYFTNVISGEIVYSLTSTQVSLANISKSELESEEFPKIVRNLMEKSLSGLISDLSSKSASSFIPRRIEAKVDGLDNGLIRFKSGFKDGIQRGDSLEDENSNLLKVVYSSEKYSYAKPVLAGPIKAGDTFGKFIVGPVDGQLRPRAVVVVSKKPDGFSDPYLSQILTEELGKKAQLTMVQVNPVFSSLVATVSEQADITSKNLGQRSLPELIVKLSIPEPLQSESKTSLDFKTVRATQAYAYGWVIDQSGRVVAVSEGFDRQEVEVVKGLDLDPKARKEIAVKNAILDLSEKLKNAVQVTLRQAEVTAVLDRNVTLDTKGTVLFEKTEGVVLKKAGFISAPLPAWEASVSQEMTNGNVVKTLLPIAEPPPSVESGDYFEYRTAGKLPTSSKSFSLCQNEEVLGNTRMHSLDDVVAYSMAATMPGVFFDNSVSKKASDLLNQSTGFSSNYKANPVSTAYCIQPVQRIDKAQQECSEACQIPGTARITLRTVSGSDVVDKKGLQVQFKSKGYWPGTSEASINSVFDQDLTQEVKKLTSAIAQKISF